MNEWISVKEDLPKPEMWFVAAEIWQENDFLTNEVRTIVTCGRLRSPGSPPPDKSTHWIEVPNPLPEPPKE